MIYRSLGSPVCIRRRDLAKPDQILWRGPHAMFPLAVLLRRQRRHAISAFVDG